MLVWRSVQGSERFSHTPAHNPLRARNEISVASSLHSSSGAAARERRAQPVVEGCGAAPTRSHPSTTHGAECGSCKAMHLARRAPLTQSVLTLGHELRCYTYSVTTPKGPAAAV